MKNLAGVIAFTALTAVCWGVYGPLMNIGQHGEGHVTGTALGICLRAFICVGAAYFLVAVAAPTALLNMRGETGSWTAIGTFWSFLAGVVAAIGALCLLLAFAFNGSPVYVMPIVFGAAPVVNTFLTMFFARTYREASPIFYAGLILVVLGAVLILLFKPSPPMAAKPAAVVVESSAEAGAEAPAPKVSEKSAIVNYSLVMVFIILTGLAWGSYGPLLHKGQMAMQGSRLRPFLCVGLAYFVIAVFVPSIWIAAGHAEGNFTTVGSLWSFMGGVTGAVGALGIILAFNSGGKPIYVMPLIFGLAPVVNTFVVMFIQGLQGKIGVPFYSGLLIVVAGAVTVLISAPRTHAPPAR